MTDSPPLAEQLQHVLGRRVENLRRLSGGASRETWAFDVADVSDANNADTPLILRRDPPHGARVGGMPLEARLFAAASQAGVPVPKLIASGDADPSALGTGFLVMEHVAGETIARKILRDEPYAHARSVVVGQLGAAIARLHSVDPVSIEGLPTLDPLVKYRELLDTFEQPSPTFELAYRWLLAHRPEPIAPVVVHGDYRLGNVIVNEHGLAAVLDWELAHLGDPAEDLGWLCVRAWRFGGKEPVAGMGSYKDLLDSYLAAGGAPIDLARVRWWELAGTFMWGVMCMLQASAHTSGAMRSVELAAIGRRVAEQEHDLLELLGAPGTAPELPLADPALSSIAGTPSIDGLLAAVREFLVGDVMHATSGRIQFHARVASNVLAMLEREGEFGPKLALTHDKCLSQIGITEKGLDGERILADAVRSGRFDDRLSEIAQLLRPVVSLRLAIANPKHFAS